MKDLHPAGIKCHSFPALGGHAPCDSACQGKDRSGDFIPLYSPSRQSLRTSDTNDAADGVDQVRQDKFQEGFDAGCDDACLLARQELAPEAMEFSMAFKQLNEFSDQIEERSCQYISRMALGIAEKILGGPTHLKIEDLAAFTVELKRQMSRFYQLNLTLSPEDKINLMNLMACEDPQWNECSSIIKINEDEHAENGSLHTERDLQPLILNEILSKSLDNLLAGASTK